MTSHFIHRSPIFTFPITLAADYSDVEFFLFQPEKGKNWVMSVCEMSHNSRSVQ